MRSPDGEILVVMDAQFIWNGCNFTLTAQGMDLDFLGEMTGLGTYDDVIGNTAVIELSSLIVHVLGLKDLIKTKQAVGRPKDLAVLPILKELQRQLNQE